MDAKEPTLDIEENSKPMPPEFAKLVNDNFWDLVDEQPGGREDG